MLGLLTVIAVLGGLAPAAWANMFLNETFDGTVPSMVGWENNVMVLERDYVAGVGVGGSRAMQMSGQFYDGGYDAWFAMMYLNGTISGNSGATLANTMLSFDVKTDVIGYGLSIGLQSWPGNWYSGGSMGVLVGSVPIWETWSPDFQTITVCLADPLWTLPPWDPSQTIPFHPEGGTIQVYFQAESWSFGGPGAEVTVTVDNVRFWTVPNLENLTASQAVLWPPDHKMVRVVLDYTLVIGCLSPQEVTTTVSVASNEPVNGLGDGDMAPDWQIIDAHHVLLRAERSGTGQGRVYTITVTATDESGNSSSQSTTVTVPLALAP